MSLEWVWLFPEMSTKPGFDFLPCLPAFADFCLQEFPWLGPWEPLGRAYESSEGSDHCAWSLIQRSRKRQEITRAN